MRNTLLALSFLLSTAAYAQQTDDLIIPLAGAPDILVPAAGDVTGANGTHFRSDITVINLRPATQRVRFYWMPQGESGTLITPATIDMPGGTGMQSEDFVGTFLHKSGLGSIEVQGVNSDGTPDPAAQLYVAARIWTPRPDGGSGTMSQTFPAIALVAEASKLKSVFGMRRTAQYRMNLGISNPTSQARRFRVTTVIVPSSGTPVQSQLDVDVLADSVEQRALSGTAEGIAQVLIEDITSPAVAGTWHAWVSSIDNASGDAWSQMAIPGQ